MKDNGANSSRELKIQNGPFDGINAKAHALKCTGGMKSTHGSLTFYFLVLCYWPASVYIAHLISHYDLPGVFV